MRMLVTSDRTFVYHPYTLDATDVTFQQANRPAGNTAEALPYYSAQHKLYGYKVEANEALHHATRRKTDEDRMLRDTGLLSAEYPDEWAVFAGKGYQGAKQHVCCINPTKDTNLSAAVAQQNADISSDRIIVENWFGKFVGYGVFAPTSNAGRRTSTMTSSRPVQR
ncbi:hypothetical protein PR003_g2377 [Phytophthora rubi]|uniref:DDE Tnp4 domain-containing protein n=1 Tax=Phytophthora rubi TaxID=129364 RepID=A0A6A4FSX2_9STRA|nr:hypothetical protein PR001_g4432 [Phytophthora rubi]KAE9356331.1 hypothetical protein PR003_g2377 [Phytophthora rubi]